MFDEVRKWHAADKNERRFSAQNDAIDWLSTVSFVTDKPPATFAELYAEWSAQHYPTISDKKAGLYEAAYKKCSALHGKKWSEVGLRHMQTIINEQKETYYPRRELKVLFSLMSKYAIIAGYSDKDLSPALKLPPKAKPHKEAFSESEIEALWEDYEAGNSFTGAILLMIYTGMRYGELTTILPENVHIDDSYLIGGKKTEAGRSGEILLVEKVKPIAKRLLVDGGLPRISDTAFRQRFNQALERPGCRSHTIHECRHTTATVLAKAGVQPAIISEIITRYIQTIKKAHKFGLFWHPVGESNPCYRRERAVS